MNIQGIQKMTLLDYPGKVACTVFLAGCNLRCPFCHNSELLDGTAETVMDDIELLAFLRKRQGLLDGICFTGGEPLMRRELPALLEQVKQLGYPVKLDTNGTFFDRLQLVVSEGLVDYVAMDIKNDAAHYAQTSGVSSLDMSSVNKSISYLINGNVEYEFRTTVVDEFHNEESFREIGRMIQGAKHYYLQAFIDRDSVAYAGFHAPEPAKIREYAEIVRPFVDSVGVRGVE